MINLLPPEYKKQIRAGQSNSLLLRYCVLSGLLAILLLGAAGAIYIVINMSRERAETTIEESKAKSAAYAESQQQSDTFRNNLTIAKTILDKEVRYSAILIQIAQTLPSGVVLQSIQLDAKSFGKPITLSAAGKSYDDALRLKTAFENSSYFSEVSLQSVSNNQKQAGNESHPVSISISVTISPEIVKL